MDLFFADDSRQQKPSRAGMGPLVAIGGLHVSSENVRALENAINGCCADFGFPQGHEFKWSPGPELWMHKNLIGEPRQRFFLAVLDLVKESGGQACVIVEDEHRDPASEYGVPHLEDAVTLFLERAQKSLGRSQSHGIVIVDRPGGSRGDEDRFLANCLESILSGTTYVQFRRIILNVLSTSSRLVRLLQVADVIVGCTTAFVSGEPKYSAPVFNAGIRPLLASSAGRVGGIGLKLHPDFCYANLYHWLVGDSHFWTVSTGLPLPLADRPYFDGPDCP